METALTDLDKFAVEFWQACQIPNIAACWHHTEKGIQYRGQDHTPHRIAWYLANITNEEENIFPLPEGLALLHTCKNLYCCNPSHMKLVNWKYGF